MTEKDVKIVNVKTDETPQALKSGAVDAIGAWQPNSGAALKEVPGSTPIFTSADVPGLIYDMLARQSEEPGRAPRRLDQGRQGLVPRRRLHQRTPRTSTKPPRS